jgi:hypothetical protein
MTLLLAIDPGKVTGLALFREGVLAACNATDGDRIWSTWDGPGKGPISIPVDRVVIERPAMRGTDGRNRINDLIALAIRVGRAAGPWGASVTWVRPEQWKRQLPKELAARRFLALLSAQERELVPPDHNVQDAVGLGLYALGRWRT